MTQRCVERVARKQCSRSHPIACLRRGALHWRVPTAVLVRKARCESRLRWWAFNPSGATGLLQFLPSTWQTTPYADKPIWSVKWQGLAGGYMHAAGRGGEWSCR